MINVTVLPFEDVRFSKLNVLQLETWNGNVYYFNHLICEWIEASKVDELAGCYSLNSVEEIQLAQSLAYLAAQREGFVDSKIRLVEVNTESVIN